MTETLATLERIIYVLGREDDDLTRAYVAGIRLAVEAMRAAAA